MHKSLNEVAKRKTEIIVKGDIQGLQTILNDENKHIKAIQQLNNLMLQAGESFLTQLGSPEPLSLSVVIQHAENEKEILAQKKEQLEDQISLLRKQNTLNQELLEQSLQFVNLSLDMLMPDMDSFNYGRSDESDQEMNKKTRSIFDSKA